MYVEMFSTCTCTSTWLVHENLLVNMSYNCTSRVVHWYMVHSSAQYNYIDDVTAPTDPGNPSAPRLLEPRRPLDLCRTDDITLTSNMIVHVYKYYTQLCTYNVTCTCTLGRA